jgi:capsular polysaccharide transport system permease protein
VIGVILLLSWCSGLALGLLTEALSPVFESINVVMGQIVRFLYFVSGIFYTIDGIPAAVAKILIWNPQIHLITLMRSEVSHERLYPGISLAYPAVVVMAMFLLGLIAERVMRHRVLEAA